MRYFYTDNLKQDRLGPEEITASCISFFTWFGGYLMKIFVTFNYEGIAIKKLIKS